MSDTYDEVLRKQRERQQIIRQKDKAKGKPSRDDIARVLLHMMIMSHHEANAMDELDEYSDLIVDQLVAQGFDKNASYSVFENLVEKYTKSNWQFRRKLQLKEIPET